MKLLTLLHIFNSQSIYNTRMLWGCFLWEDLIPPRASIAMSQRLLGLCSQPKTFSWTPCLHSQLPTVHCYRHLNYSYEELNSLFPSQILKKVTTTHIVAYFLRKQCHPNASFSINNLHVQSITAFSEFCLLNLFPSLHPHSPATFWAISIIYPFYCNSMLFG